MKTKTITSKYNIKYDETQVGLATPGTAAKITTFQRNRVSKRKYAAICGVVRHFRLILERYLRAIRCDVGLRSSKACIIIMVIYI